MKIPSKSNLQTSQLPMACNRPENSQPLPVLTPEQEKIAELMEQVKKEDETIRRAQNIEQSPTFDVSPFCEDQEPGAQFYGR